MSEVHEWAPQPIGAVFNNAGVTVASRVLEAVPDDDQWLWDVDFGGVGNGATAFLPILVEQDEGVIVNTSSVFGLVGMPTPSAYCAAKFAVCGFTDSFARNCAAPAFRRVTVHPGGHQHQHRAQRPLPAGSRRPRPHPGTNGPGFAAITMTQPDKAAAIIHRGVEAGKGRILGVLQ